MYKAETQRGHVQPQPEVKQEIEPLATLSPQGERITQLDALANSSTQSQKLWSLSTLMNARPHYIIQRKQLEIGEQQDRLPSGAFINVIQRAITAENHHTKADEFNRNHEREQKHINRVNILLMEYSRAPTLDIYEMAQAQIQDARNKIEDIHNTQAALLGEYLDESSNAEAKKEFLKAIIPGFSDEDSELVDKIAGNLQRQDDDQLEDEFTKLRGRYLSFIVQGLRTKTGKVRLNEFGILLGERNIKLGKLGAEFGAGFHNEHDTQKGQTTKDRSPQEDLALLQEVGGNLSKFIKLRFGNMGGEDRRTPNSQAAETGDLAVYLEKHQKLFPLYIGQQEEGNVSMYTSPLFTAIHHETGHLVNYLKGVSGGKNSYRGDGNDLRYLTDEEEVHNISIDPHGDKAMSDELELPARIAHSSYMGLDVSRESWSEDDVHNEMMKWNVLTGQDNAQQYLVRDLQNRISNLATHTPQFHVNLFALADEVNEWLFSLTDEVNNEWDKQRLADAIAWSLDKLEHKIYDRLALYQRSPQYALIKPDAPEFMKLNEDQDKILTSHRRYIETIVSGRLKLWVHGSWKERNTANIDWQRLLDNDKGIRIDAETAEEFKIETQANIARLLSRPVGRKLVNTLMRKDNALEISTPMPDQVERIRGYYERQGLTGSELEATVRSSFGGQAGPTNPERAFAVEGLNGLQRGTGSSSTMAMRTGAMDSEGASTDRSGKLILSPGFIELGHEMIHALHNITGANLKSKGQYQGSPWDNMSEHSVIEGTPEIQELLGNDFVTENQLRDDHNLGERFGHDTTKALVAATQAKLLTIANKPGWDELGGTVFNQKTPDGIVQLRHLLTQQPVNWNTVYNLVHPKVTRNVVENLFLAVSSMVTTFYGKVDEFCTIYRGNQHDVSAIRDFLDELKNYNPV